MKELGELIRAARQRKGVTLDQASAETRIRQQYLDAIEDGDFRIFPGAAYATGFLRNYASYLGLNQDDILQAYHGLAPPSGIFIAPATTVGAERLKRRSRRRLTWLVASVVLVVVAVAAISKYNSDLHSAGKAPQLPAATSGGLTSPRSNHHAGDNGDQLPPLRGWDRPEATIHVRALHTAWVRAVVGDRQVYWGPIHAGRHRSWRGSLVRVTTHRGTAFTIRVNGRRAGFISRRRGRRVSIVAHPHRWQRIG